MCTVHGRPSRPDTVDTVTPPSLIVSLPRKASRPRGAAGSDVQCPVDMAGRSFQGITPAVLRASTPVVPLSSASNAELQPRTGDSHNRWDGLQRQTAIIQFKQS
jgi:hypothetical protein